MPTKRHRYAIAVPFGFEDAIKARAEQLGRPVANYLEWLMREDLKKHGIEIRPASTASVVDAPAHKHPPVPLSTHDGKPFKINPGAKKTA